MGGHIVAAPVDVGDPDSVETLFEFVATTLGRIDVLFNNAGIGGSGESVENVSLVEWDAVLGTNWNRGFPVHQGGYSPYEIPKPTRWANH